jgi:dephospho-CoA kinase
VTRVFGLTGGIASGKTTVARRFEELGIPVVYADVLAREAVAKGTDGFDAVVAAFGAEVIGADGELDRRLLGARVFGDETARRTLNAIVHPRVGALALARFQELSAKGHALVCYEVPLLVEGGLQEMFRPVVVVAAPEAEQVARAAKRDGLSEDEVRARVASQLPLEKKIAVADHVIWNTGTREELLEKVDALAATLRAAKAD